MNRRKAEQTVTSVLTITTTGLMCYVMLRLVLGPDVMTRIQMQAYRSVARTAKHGGDALLIIAARADTAYHKARNATV